ncbi:EAL domain-containing protein [Pseudoalteromonas sp. B193]
MYQANHMVVILIHFLLKNECNYSAPTSNRRADAWRLERNEFELFYQPQFDAKNKHIIGAEALLRWHNPVLGNVTPDEFIPIAENTGLIVPIGKFVISQALDFKHMAKYL